MPAHKVGARIDTLYMERWNQICFWHIRIEKSQRMAHTGCCANVLLLYALIFALTLLVPVRNGHGSQIIGSIGAPRYLVLELVLAGNDL